MRSSATTVAQYLEELPADRRATIAAVRTVLRRHMPKGYREGMCWGMITWSIPLRRFPATYNGQPLAYVALASQKGYCSLYLTCVYGCPAQEKRLREGFRAAGKKLDKGKSCVRFQKADDLALDVIGEIVASTPPQTLIDWHEAAHRRK